MDKGRRVAELFRQRDRAFSPGDRALEILGQHRELGEIAVGHRQLAAVRERLQDRERLPGEGCSLGRVAGEPGIAGEHPHALAKGEHVVLRGAQRHCLLLGRDRIGELASEVALVGAGLEQAGVFRWRCLGGVAEGAGVLRGCLLVRFVGHRLPGGGERVGVGGVKIASLVGVIGEQGMVVPEARIGPQHGEDAPVQAEFAHRGDGLGDRVAHGRVPELDRFFHRPEETDGKALVDRLLDRAADHGFEHERVDGHTHRGGGRQEGACLRREAAGAGHDRVLDRDRVGGIRIQDLADVERIAGRVLAEQDRVDLPIAAELGDCRNGERWQDHPSHRGRGGEVAHHPAQGMARGNLVVAIGGEEERAQVADPAAQEVEQVERRLVAPVHILDGEHGQAGRLDEGRFDRAENPVAGGPGIEQVDNVRPEGMGDIQQRSQRAVHPQAIAGDDQHPAGVVQLLPELFDQGGFADPHFAADEDE